MCWETRLEIQLADMLEWHLAILMVSEWEHGLETPLVQDWER